MPHLKILSFIYETRKPDVKIWVYYIQELTVITQMCHLHIKKNKRAVASVRLRMNKANGIKVMNTNLTFSVMLFSSAHQSFSFWVSIYLANNLVWIKTYACSCSILVADGVCRCGNRSILIFTKDQYRLILYLQTSTWCTAYISLL